MKATIEQVDLLRSRANVGYKEAKEALEMFEGDLVEALAYLDGQNKIKSEKCCQGKGFMDTISSIIEKGNKTFLKITKNESTMLNLPFTIVVPLAILVTPLMIGVLIIALVTGCKIKFQGAKGEECSVNEHIEKVSDIMNDAAQKFEQELAK